jgi:anti-sigma regulatory factor (Ser/Thr protein kinase)
LKNASNIKPAKLPESLVCGQYSKREAAQLIAAGAKHLHSSPHGERDACARLTAEMLSTGSLKAYPWEIEAPVSQIVLSASADRQKLIRHVISETAITNRRELSEKLGLVMEELMTNAIYHSYLGVDGNQKYARQQVIKLGEPERIQISFAGGKKGLFISVTDHGGTIQFEHLANSFLRCYGKNEQIENKSSGAGLGLYMVFELVTHLKIVCYPGQKSTVTCWLADSRSFDPGQFSFNFFQGGSLD